MGIINSIKKYYQRKGISPASYRDFQCPNKSLCKANCQRLMTGNEPLIGLEYEKRTLPRLLIVSAEPAGDEFMKTWKQRTVEAHRIWERSEIESMRKGSGLHPRTHWYKTNQLARWIFEAIVPERELQKVSPYFAHTNSGKCSQNRDGHAQATDVLFRNCRDYLGSEIRILRPDIIVTQGMWARIAVQNANFRVINGAGGSISECCAAKSQCCGYKILQIAGRRVLWIAGHHPNSRKKYYQQMNNCWDSWSRRIKRFVRDEGLVVA
jgi:hypothetical protein